MQRVTGELAELAAVKLAEVLEQNVSFARRHLARYVLCPQLALGSLTGGHPGDDLWHGCGELSSPLDP